MFPCAPSPPHHAGDPPQKLATLAHLRYSSRPLPRCTAAPPGSRVSAFKCSTANDIWVDALLLEKKPAGRCPSGPAGACGCIMRVRWMDTSAAGEEADLHVREICTLDPRPIGSHPKAAEWAEMLGEQLPGQDEEEEAGDGKEEGAGGSRPSSRRRRLTEMVKGGGGKRGSTDSAAAAGGGEAVPESPPAPPSGGKTAQAGGAARAGGAGATGADPCAHLRPPECARGPICVLCYQPTLLQG